ncbi:glycosyltransferase [Candidatus Falkowbacteria bacterium]|nr:glycosyltransferase [Candidatus Falkowbacteria bacterium]
MSPKLSVIIPTKNRSRYLAQAIKSIIKQTFKNWELIIIDDHSQEDIKKVTNSFKDKRIKYFRLKKGTGIAAARNFGNLKAKSPIIVVADSDDLNYPSRLKITYNHFQKNSKTDFFYGNMDIYSEKKDKKTKRWFQPYNQELLYQINYIPHPASAYKKEIFQKVNGYDESLKVSADYNLWLTFADANVNFGYTKKTLSILRLHQGNISKEYALRLKSHIEKIRQKHKIKKQDISLALVKKLAVPSVYKAFSTPFQKKLWFN